MAFSETYAPAKRIDEWHKLHELLEHWNNCVKYEGFMNPISVLDEEGLVFQTIWFARSVCGRSPISPTSPTMEQLLLTMHSLLLADVSSGPDTPINF